MVSCIVIVQVKLVLHVPSASMNAGTKECYAFTKTEGIWLSTKMHSSIKSKYSQDINTRKTEMLTNCERKDTEREMSCRRKMMELLVDEGGFWIIPL